MAGLINAQPMGFYPVEVLTNDAKRHGVCVLPVDVNRSRYRTTSEWVGMPDEPLPEGAGIDERPPIVKSSACVVPDEKARDHWAAPTSIGYGIRLGLHLVKGIGEAEGEALDAEISTGGPFASLADLVARTGLSEEVVERLIRSGALDSLDVPRRRLLWQLREVAGATRGRYDGRSIGSKKAQGRPLDLRLPPTLAPDLATTDRAREDRRRLRDPVARRAQAGRSSCSGRHSIGWVFSGRASWPTRDRAR